MLHPGPKIVFLIGVTSKSLFVLTKRQPLQYFMDETNIQNNIKRISEEEHCRGVRISETSVKCQILNDTKPKVSNK